MTIKARIYRSGKRSFECHTTDGTIIQAWAQATLLKENHLVVGDWVELENRTDQSWWITKVEPRGKFVYRNLPREQKKKVIATNVDLMMIIVSGEKPNFKRGLVDRYLVRMGQWDLPAIIIFNKMDLYDGDFDLKFEMERLKDLNVVGYEVSSIDPNYKPRFLQNGFHELQNHLRNKTAILLGQSGVGKSRLITELSEGKSNLLSGELGKVGKGAHTTTWAEMIDCKNFFLIDSPGIRSMSLSDIYQDEMLEYFPDLDKYSVQCKYQNCQHLESSQGCYFKTITNNEMLTSRLESSQRIRDEASSKAHWERN